MKNRKTIYTIIFLILALSLAAFGIRNLATTDPLEENPKGTVADRINQYKIEVELNNKDKTYKGKQWTKYINNSSVDLKEIYFNIYPNAFKTLKDAPILFSGMDSMDPKKYIGGSIEIDKVLLNNKELKYSIQGKGETILQIELDNVLSPNQEADIYMEYKVKLPTAQERFGYGERVINLGNWYPIACVYDEDGWNLEPYYKIGDPFYSDMGNYQVSITLDKDLIVASTGNIISEKIKGNKKTYEIKEDLVRDFALVISKDFKIKERQVDNTMIKLYYLDNKPPVVEYSLKVGEKSLRTFNKIFGQYPYDNYSIVITEFPSGMEYPGIVFIGEDYFNNSLRDVLEKIIVHETAHQWWYGIVGNDQINEPWLDESLTTYSEVIYMKEVYGKTRGKEHYEFGIKTGYDYGKLYLGGDHIVNKSLKEFSGWDDYGILVYNKGAIFINEIKEEYGDAILYKILRTYFDRYKFTNASTEDFIEVCREFTDSKFDAMVRLWLYNEK